MMTGVLIVGVLAGLALVSLLSALVPARLPGTRRPGSWKGQVIIAPDFDDTPDDLVAAFHDDVEPRDR